MAAPFEIIGAPLRIWLAPYGTAFPLFDATPATIWVELGTSGTHDQEEGGVTVTHTSTYNDIYGAGDTAPIKTFRDHEEVTISVAVHDLTLEVYRIALGKALTDITTTAPATGTAGTKSLTLRSGPSVLPFAFVARGVSPYNDDTFTSQYQVPKVYQSANPAPVYRKGQPAGLQLAFKAQADLNAAVADRLGRLIEQNLAAI